MFGADQGLVRGGAHGQLLEYTMGTDQYGEHYLTKLELALCFIGWHRWGKDTGGSCYVTWIHCERCGRARRGNGITDFR